MAILYVFTHTDPNNVGPFPPSINGTAWETQLKEFGRTTSTLTPLGYPTPNASFFIFADEAAVINFLNTYRCTDATLLSDIAEWKAAHNISYATNFYQISESEPLSISVDPLVS